MRAKEDIRLKKSLQRCAEEFKKLDTKLQTLKGRFPQHPTALEDYDYELLKKFVEFGKYISPFVIALYQVEACVWKAFVRRAQKDVEYAWDQLQTSATETGMTKAAMLKNLVGETLRSSNDQRWTQFEKSEELLWYQVLSFRAQYEKNIDTLDLIRG